MKAGLNLEFARSAGWDLRTALHFAHEAGYGYVEPFVYAPFSFALNSHVKIQTVSDYHHIHCEQTDMHQLRCWVEQLGLHFSAWDAHGSLLMPQLSVGYLRHVIDLAADLGCPLVMSDEGPVSVAWMNLDRAFDILCFTLEPIIKHAQARQVLFALELHNALTAQPHYVERLLTRFGPDELAVNFDTGNSFLAGNDPVEYVQRVAQRVVHVHIKDIPAHQLAERGKVTGTRVGVAAGEGVVDLRGIVRVLKKAGYRGVLSVECDTPEQAKASKTYLEQLIASI